MFCKRIFFQLTLNQFIYEFQLGFESVERLNSVGKNFVDDFEDELINDIILNHQGVYRLSDISGEVTS